MINDAWFDGFWQVVIDDADEQIQPTPRTTAAVRASACWIYAGSHYMEFRADKDRPLATALPLSDEDAAAMFRGHRATGGRIRWEERDGATLIQHEPTIAVDPRHLEPFTMTVRRAGDDAAEAQRNGAGNAEEWRRLSGRAEPPLAGAWENVDEEERYFYIVTQGHYGVMRTPVKEADVATRARHGATLSIADEAALFAASSFNGGARLFATQTLDHWPMFASTSGYEVNKHPTFFVASVNSYELRLSFGRDEPAAPWRRLG